MTDFIRRYDDGSFRFPDIRFRDGAEWQLHFRIFVESAGDFKTNRLWFEDGRPVYIHPAIDRSAGAIICPFESMAEWFDDVPGYGTILILRPIGADFEIRIAHMDRPAHPVRYAILKGKPVPAGAFLGNTGTRGIGTGPHSHVEAVSIGESSEICGAILKARGYSIANTMADAEARMNSAEKEFFRNYTSARDFVMFSDHACIRNDGFRSVGRVTYYSTRSLFGM